MGSQEARVPRLIAGLDLTSQPLSPFEGFVLSRVDGEATVGTLSDLVGLEVDELLALLERMIELGVVEWRVETVSLPRATGRAAAQGAPEPSLRDDILSGRTTIRRGGGRIRLTKKRQPSAARPEGVYTGAAPEEHVEPTRRSVLRPRTSHSGGSIVPPGDVVDDFEEQSLEELAAALGAVTEELSGAHTPVPDSVADPHAATEPPPASLDEMLSDAVPLLDETPADSPVGEEAAAEEPPGEEPAAEEPAAEEPAAEEPAAEEPAAEEPSAEPENEDDALDLDEDRRKRIDDLYFALDLLDHYQVLGVERTSVRKDIRHSYFTLSKVFHPDTMYGKKLGTYVSKMEAIFQRLTEAYEVLGKKKRRAEYDRYLEVQDRTRAIEQAINPDHESDERERLGKAAARGEADEASDKAAASPRKQVEPLVPEPEAEAGADAGAEATPEPESEPPPVVESKREMSPEARERARQLMAKKLRNAARASSGRRVRPDVRRSAPPPPSTVAIGKENVLRGLAKSLRATASHTGGLDRVRRHVVAAERAEKEGNLADAANSLRLALSLDPERKDIKAEYARVNGALAGELATSYEEQAIYEQRHGKWGAAALSWSHVVEGRPDDPMPARRAAECLMEAKGDLHKAAELAKKAHELAPDDIGCMRTLAKVYVQAGLGLNAKRVLQRAAELDPDDEIVENLLRELG